MPPPSSSIRTRSSTSSAVVLFGSSSVRTHVAAAPDSPALSSCCGPCATTRTPDRTRRPHDISTGVVNAIAATPRTADRKSVARGCVARAIAPNVTPQSDPVSRRRTTNAISHLPALRFERPRLEHLDHDARRRRATLVHPAGCAGRSRLYACCRELAPAFAIPTDCSERLLPCAVVDRTEERSSLRLA